MPSPCVVSGNLSSLFGGNASFGTVTFSLSNIGTGNPIVAGGGGIVPALTITAQANEAGAFSTQLWGNDNIQPSNTLYSVTFRDASRNELGPILYSITGATVNLNSLAAASGSVPPVFVNGAVLLNPNAAQVIAGFGLSVPSLNGVVFADQHSGADAFAKINAACASLPNGGIVDARGFGQSVQAVSTPLLIGGAGQRILLLLDANTEFEISVTGGVDAIQLYTESAIVALNATNAQPNATFSLTSAANVNSILGTYPQTGETIVYLQGLTFEGNASATVADSLVNLVNLTDMSTIRNCVVYNFFGTGIHLQSKNAISIGPVNFDNCTVNGFGNAGAQPVLIDPGTSTGFIGGVNFIGGSYTHPGSGGHPIVWLKGAASSSNGIIEGVTFVGCQFESINSGDIGILIENARNVVMVGLLFTAESTAGASCIQIAQDSGGTTISIIAECISNFNAWTNTINDLMNSVTITDSRVTSYKVANNASAIERWVGAFGTYGLVAQLSLGGFQAPTLVVTAATPTGTGTQLSLGNTTGFGNGTAGTAVTTTTKGTGTGPTNPQTVVDYLEIDKGGVKYWQPLMQ